MNNWGQTTIFNTFPDLFIQAPFQQKYYQAGKHRMSLEKMKEVFVSQLELIDPMLARVGIKLNVRPLEAAIIFVEHCIVSIEGDTKDNFFERHWFADIYSWSEEWYRNRYGKNFAKSDEKKILGAVLIYETAYLVSIPLTKVTAGESKDTRWLTFPINILPDENPLNWIVNSPNLEALDEGEKGKLISDVQTIANLSREISCNLMTAMQDSSNLRQLGTSIPIHISSAAGHIVSRDIAQTGLALWDIHLAHEKAIKMNLIQRKIEFKKIHNLHKMSELAKANGISVIEENIYSQLPGSKEVISLRYGESSAYSAAEAIEFFCIHLRAISLYTKCLKRKLVMENASFLIKQPPWMTPHKQKEKGC